ncbi:hypothetical protein EV363DRAFT_1329386 [Boletus edulis]|nr:hypothetical protein EV363DRAFT_1329386 [Boletus edulis]
MLHSSAFHFGKTKNMVRDYHVRKAIDRHRFRDVSHIKLTDIFKSLRRRRYRSKVPQRYSLTRSGSFPPPLANHDSSPVPPLSPDIFTPSSRRRYRSDAVSILSATESDCLSSFGLKGTLPVAERERHFSPRPFPTFATSPSLFQLRSSSTKDYLVDRLEEHLRQLSLGDASPDLLNNSSRDIPMEMCADVSLPRTIDSEMSSRRVLSDRDAKNTLSSPRDQNVVPMILVTSVDAKHAKPLPPSSKRPSRTPLGPSNITNHPTNVPSTKPKPKTSHDDPFTTQSHSSVLPPNYNLTFRLPAFPMARSSPTKYVLETPTPMCCDHVGDCRGDLWEVLHPPLVVDRFTLPPFKLPPLSTGLFGDMFTPLP